MSRPVHSAPSRRRQAQVVPSVVFRTRLVAAVVPAVGALLTTTGCAFGTCCAPRPDTGPRPDAARADAGSVDAGDASRDAPADSGDDASD